VLLIDVSTPFTVSLDGEWVLKLPCWALLQQNYFIWSGHLRVLAHCNVEVAGELEILL